MNCPDCGREMIRAQARFEGQETTCGFRACRCSWTCYLENKEDGEGFQEYRQRMNEDHALSKAGLGLHPSGDDIPDWLKF